jgi:hypothetical protein
MPTNFSQRLCNLIYDFLFISGRLSWQELSQKPNKCLNGTAHRSPEGIHMHYQAQLMHLGQWAAVTDLLSSSNSRSICMYSFEQLGQKWISYYFFHVVNNCQILLCNCCVILGTYTCQFSDLSLHASLKGMLYIARVPNFHNVLRHKCYYQFDIQIAFADIYTVKQSY